ncbi:hypothetical protein IAU59_005053 [Kwoniella sp. CBS 9459]
MSAYPIEPEDLHSILSYLDPSSSSSTTSSGTDLPATLPLPPLKFLHEHFDQLPPSLLRHFAFIPPKQRTSIPSVKHRRLLYATAQPRPLLLDASEGRLRWPLLWERLGGDPFPPPSHGVEEEERWVSEKFMPVPDDISISNPIIASHANPTRLYGDMSSDTNTNININSNQQVKKLGGFLRLLEEEREAEGIRAAKRMERRLDTEGEEFDEERDEEDDDEGGRIDVDVQAQRPNGTGAAGDRPVIAEDQAEVTRLFEKRLLELFLDGLDTIDYTPIDFNEPEGGDPIAIRDAEDRYFDDEEPSRTPGGHVQGESSDGPSVGRKTDQQNGQGEYDY